MALSTQPEKKCICKSSRCPDHDLGDKTATVTRIDPTYVCQLEELQGNVDVPLGIVLLPSEWAASGNIARVMPRLIQKNS